MIYNASELVFYALLIVALLQPNPARFVAGASFAIAAILHGVLFAELDGLGYYGSAALFDFSVILLTMRLKQLDRSIILIHRVLIASIVGNFAGWILWFTYQPPFFYDLTFLAIYLMAFWIFAKRKRDDVGIFKRDQWSIVLCCYNFTGFKLLFKNGGEI